jgi:SHS2 domain-containing protein
MGAGMEAATTRWEHFAHGADIGVRGSGRTKGEAFEQAALALTAVLTDPGAVATTTVVEIHREAPDDELLLVDWLNAVIYEMATRNMVFGRFAVTITGNLLSATAWGEPVDRARHRPAVEAKGATYTALSVAQGKEGAWIAQCVVDV